MGALNDIIIGGMLIAIFFSVLPEVQTLTDVTPGEQIIIVVLLAYGAIFGLRIAANALVIILEGIFGWFFKQTELGKSIRVRVNTAFN